MRKAYRPQLDALRGIAIAGVLESHFLSDGPSGSLGVRLFFVLSGFLITNILFEARAQRTRSGSMGLLLRNFFIRRGLRIWPAYYTVIALLFATNAQDFRSVAVWHALFASNLLFFIEGFYKPWATAALWSLSVEEQFYLVWPFIIICVEKKLIWRITGTAILVGLTWHIITAERTFFASSFLPPASFDALGAGALISLCGKHIERWRRCHAPMIVLSGSGTLIAIATEAPFPLIQLVSLVCMTGLVCSASVHAGGFLGWVLNRPALQALGRISFGVYLYHVFVYAAIIKLSGGTPPFDGRSWPMLLLASSVTILVAALSWRFIERPANGLKRYFPIAQLTP